MLRVVSPAGPLVVCAAAISGSCAVALPFLCSLELAVPDFGCCVLGLRVSTTGPALRIARAAEAGVLRPRAVRVGASEGYGWRLVLCGLRAGGHMVASFLSAVSSWPHGGLPGP